MENKTFGNWSKTVENPSPEYKEYFFNEKKFLNKYLSKNSVALDVGCGDGRIMKTFASKVKEVIGIDNDFEAVLSAKKNLVNINNVNVFLEDAKKTHFNKTKFDVIFIGLTFSNFGNSKKKILAELKRILKDNGKLIFSVFNEDALVIREKEYNFYEGGYSVINRKKGKILFNKDGSTSEQFTKDEIKKLLNKAGFKELNISKGKLYYLISAKKLN